jgi:NAD(P)H-hydrate epimerase
MSDLPQQLYRGEQVRELDRAAIQQFGISGTVLMERAGAAAFTRLQHQWPNVRRIGVICGVGNNGGDGFVVARLAREANIEVRVYQVGDADRLQGDALAASQRLFSSDVNVEPFADKDLRECDVLVDGILGTGLSGEVRGEAGYAIERINRAGVPVLSLDIPSGLNADTGALCGAAVKADCTVTFVGVKQGLLTGKGPEYCGQLYFDDLRIPSEAYQGIQPSAQRLSYPALASRLRPRPRDAHKGDCGHVLVVGGEAGFTGAARMAGEAALRMGAGLVSIATREAHAAVLSGSRPELMCHGVEDEATFHRLAERATVIAIGPGLGQGEWSAQQLHYAMDTGLPLVLDADALNLLSQEVRKRDNWILTPHPAEAARLLGKSTQEVNRDRFAALREVVETYGGVALLKGAGTLVMDGDSEIGVCDAGNPGMASGGMGDVLTGVISGLLAQGLGLDEAASLGVCLHAAAGDEASRTAGERGLIASDLMPWIRRLANPTK